MPLPKIDEIGVQQRLTLPDILGVAIVRFYIGTICSIVYNTAPRNGRVVIGTVNDREHCCYGTSPDIVWPGTDIPMSSASQLWQELYQQTLSNIYKATLPGCNTPTERTLEIIRDQANAELFFPLDAGEHTSTVDLFGILCSIYRPSVALQPTNGVLASHYFGEVTSILKRYALSLWESLLVTESLRLATIQDDIMLSMSRLLASDTPEGINVLIYPVTVDTVGVICFDNRELPKEVATYRQAEEQYVGATEAVAKHFQIKKENLDAMRDSHYRGDKTEW